MAFFDHAKRWWTPINMERCAFLFWIKTMLCMYQLLTVHWSFWKPHGYYVCDAYANVLVCLSEMHCMAILLHFTLYSLVWHFCGWKSVQCSHWLMPTSEKWVFFRHHHELLALLFIVIIIILARSTLGNRIAYVSPIYSCNITYFFPQCFFFSKWYDVLRTSARTRLFKSIER